MSGSASIVWDLPLTVRVKRWLIAFSSLNKIAGPVAYGRPCPLKTRLCRRLRVKGWFHRLAWKTPADINLVLTSLKQRPGQRPQGTCVEEELRDAQPGREDCCGTLGGRRDRDFFFN